MWLILFRTLAPVHALWPCNFPPTQWTNIISHLQHGMSVGGWLAGWRAVRVNSVSTEHITRLQDLKHFTLATRKSQYK